MDTAQSYPLLGEGPVRCSYGDPDGLLYFAQDGCLTVINLHAGRSTAVPLSFTPDRFVPVADGTYAVGLDGWALLYGDTLVRELLAFGPHRILGGRPRPVMGVPDFNGLELPLEQYERHWGQPVAAALYRGELITAFRNGTAMTSCGERVGRRLYVQPTVSSRFYSHPSVSLLALSLEDRLLFSVDHGLSWHEKPTGAWPVYLSGTVWSAREGRVSREP